MNINTSILKNAQGEFSNMLKWQNVAFILEMEGWFNSQKSVSIINYMQGNHVIISLDTENKYLTPFNINSCKSSSTW